MCGCKQATPFYFRTTSIALLQSDEAHKLSQHVQLSCCIHPPMVQQDIIFVQDVRVGHFARQDVDSCACVPLPRLPQLVTLEHQGQPVLRRHQQQAAHLQLMGTRGCAQC